ncbi:MAG: glutamate--tRNA ligase [Paludibacter sp.]|nr:glutamate--tRNA ligase [Paludibacter sp.]
MKKIRVRFAPSPTGALHIGGVRTALYNYLFAKNLGGKMILRIEDTDSARFVEGAEKYIVESLNWLNINFDEGVHIGGEYAPYRQSERKEIYKKYIDYLLEKKAAYIAFDTPEELEAKRTQIANFQYDASTRMTMKNTLSLSKEEVEKMINAERNFVVRFKIEPNQIIKISDLIRGDVSVNSSVLDDKVIYKSTDQLPTYHLANVVDDHLMEISHVIRGEEWLPSTPLHVLLYRAFGWEDTMPQFAHLPLLLKPDGNGKLSKRDGDRLGFPVFPLNWNDPKTSEISFGYREKGYIPEALVNFLALLGWNPGTEQEIFSMDELIQMFSLERVSKSGAKFDYEKAKWFNHKYLQMKSNDDIADEFNKILIEKNIVTDTDTLVRIVALMKERVNFISELWEQCEFFFIAPKTYDEKAIAKRWKDDSSQQMRELFEILKNLDNFLPANTEKVVMDWISERNYNVGAVMNVLRIALVGASKGPHLFDIMEITGKEETLQRITTAVTKIL